MFCLFSIFITPIFSDVWKKLVNFAKFVEK